jgi:hypothetical protein
LFIGGTAFFHKHGAEKRPKRVVAFLTVAPGTRCPLRFRKSGRFCFPNPKVGDGVVAVKGICKKPKEGDTRSAQKQSDEFFETREDWSRRKHLILEQYLPPANRQTQKASPDGRVVILDGFAGRGRYEDGTPGSPVQMGLLAGTVRGWRNPVNLRVLNVEADAANYAELQSATQAWVEKGIITNYHATFRAALLVALQETGRLPCLPFWTRSVPRTYPSTTSRHSLLETASPRFSLFSITPHVSRIISQVHPQAGTSEKTRAGSRETLNTIFGGNHWERFLTEAPTPEGVIQCFVEGLAANCQEYQELGRPVFLCTHPLRPGSGRD